MKRKAGFQRRPAAKAFRASLKESCGNNDDDEFKHVFGSDEDDEDDNGQPVSVIGEREKIIAEKDRIEQPSEELNKINDEECGEELNEIDNGEEVNHEERREEYSEELNEIDDGEEVNGKERREQCIFSGELYEIDVDGEANEEDSSTNENQLNDGDHDTNDDKCEDEVETLWSELMIA